MVSLRDLSKGLKKLNNYKVDLIDFLNPRKTQSIISQPFQKDDSIIESDSEGENSNEGAKFEDVKDKMEPIEVTKINKKTIKKIADAIQEEKEESELFYNKPESNGLT